MVNGSLYVRLYLVWLKCHIYGCGCASAYTFRCRSSGGPFGLGLRVAVELFVTPILLERVAHMELCKLNRNSELMYVQAVLPMDMARGLRGLSHRLVTKEQKIATVEGPWWLSCRSDGQKSEANKIGIQTSGCRVRVL